MAKKPQPKTQEVEVVPKKTANAKAKKASRILSVERHYSGPIPPASEFARYEEVLPGSASRIIGMAESSLKGQIRNNYIVNLTEFFSVLLGKFFVYFLLVTSVYLLMNGKEVAALLTGFSPIIGSLYSTYKSNEEKKPKSKKKSEKKTPKPKKKNK